MASTDALVKLEQLQYYDSKLKAWVDARFTVKKLTTATDGYAASYGFFLANNEDNPTQIGETINIPKDFFVQDANIKVAEDDDDPIVGIKKGESYIDLLINTTNSETGSKHLYISLASLMPSSFEYATNDDIDAMFATASDDDDDDEIDTITIVVKKEWSNGSNEGSQPTEVTVKLNKTDGDSNPIKTETLNDGNSWTVTWGELEGTIEDYTIEEDTVENYTATGLDSPEDDTEGTYTYTITNTYDE